MPGWIPQSSLYAARGNVADGNAYRDRGAEQRFTPSGNPNLPIFNQPAANAGAPQRAGAAGGGYGAAPMGQSYNSNLMALFGQGGGPTMPQFGQRPQPGPIGELRQMGGAQSPMLSNAYAGQPMQNGVMNMNGPQLAKPAPAPAPVQGTMGVDPRQPRMGRLMMPNFNRY